MQHIQRYLYIGCKLCTHQCECVGTKHSSFTEEQVSRNLRIEWLKCHLLNIKTKKDKKERMRLVVRTRITLLKFQNLPGCQRGTMLILGSRKTWLSVDVCVKCRLHRHRNVSAPSIRSVCSHSEHFEKLSLGPSNYQAGLSCSVKCRNIWCR